VPSEALPGSHGPRPVHRSDVSMMAQRRAGRLPCGADDARDSASITAS